jgi:hypothetical protein
MSERWQERERERGGLLNSADSVEPPLEWAPTRELLDYYDNGDILGGSCGWPEEPEGIESQMRRDEHLCLGDVIEPDENHVYKPKGNASREEWEAHDAAAARYQKRIEDYDRSGWIEYNDDIMRLVLGELPRLRLPGLLDALDGEEKCIFLEGMLIEACDSGDPENVAAAWADIRAHVAAALGKR